MTDIATPTQHRHPQLQTLPETPAETNAGLATVHDGPDAIPVSAVRRSGDRRRALRERTVRTGARS
jgi:hypothetical protein